MKPEMEKETTVKTAEAKPKPQAPAPPSAIQKRVDAGMSFDLQLEQARHLVKSGLLPSHIKTPEAALVIMQTGKELGLSPMKSFRSIYVVHGQTGLTAQLMRALVHDSGQCEIFDVIEAGPTTCKIRVKRKGGFERTYTFTRAEADDAKFSMVWHKFERPRQDGKTGEWKTKDAWAKQPATMLEWRCTSKALRREFPDILLGLYTKEEIAHDVELVEAQAEGAEGGEKVTDIEVKPVAEPPKAAAAEEVSGVSDVKVKAEDMDDESIMRFAMPSGSYKGMSLTSIYYQETGNGKQKGKIYLQKVMDDTRTSANIKAILERFFALIAKEEGGKK